MGSPLGPELDELLAPSAGDLRSLSGARLFITGGTGFVGSWLLESIVWANLRLNTRITALVLTRDAAAFARKAAHLEGADEFTFLEGDVRVLPHAAGHFDGVLHAATAASTELNRDQPFVMLDTIVQGGRSVLELAAKSGPIPVLFTSSGAVYGPQPAGVLALGESYLGGPNPLSGTAAYHEGKRVGELQCALAAATHGIRPKIARLFAFVGPYLPLHKHFAIGNFIADGLAGRPICVRGDGSTVRSYLYAADMVTWLWAIYARGEPLRAYNVGSPDAVDMASLARLVAAAFDPSPAVEIVESAAPGTPRDRYVPDVARITRDLAVQQRVPLESAINRTITYYRKCADG